MSFFLTLIRIFITAQAESTAQVRAFGSNIACPTYLSAFVESILKIPVILRRRVRSPWLFR